MEALKLHLLGVNDQFAHLLSYVITIFDPGYAAVAIL